MKENPIPYMSNDKFSQQGIFRGVEEVVVTWAYSVTVV
jgi:hypothetical protein